VPLGAGYVKALPVSADEQESDCKKEVEQALWVNTEIDNYVLCQRVNLRRCAACVPKLNASPAGGAKIMMRVKAHFKKYGPSGVPKGRVEVQNLVNGRTPCLYIHVSQWSRNRKPAYVPPTLTKHTRLPDEHDKQVSEGADTDQEVQCAGSTTGSEDLFEEKTRHIDFGIDDLLPTCRGEIGNVREHVENTRAKERGRGAPLEGLDRVLDFVDQVECVFVSLVGEHDTDKSAGGSVN